MLIEKEENTLEIYNNKEECKIIEMFLNSNTSKEIKIRSEAEEMLEIIENTINSTGAILAGMENANSFENEIRNLIKVSLSSTKYCYEGEITNIKIGDEKIEVSVMTEKETQILTLPIYMREEIKYLRLGDIVYSEPSMGILKRIGRNETKSDEYDLEGNKYVSLPSGPVVTVKEKEFVLSLHEIDRSFNAEREQINSYTRDKTHEFLEKKLEEKESNKMLHSLIIIKNADRLKTWERALIHAYASENVKFILFGKKEDEEILSIQLNSKIDNAEEYLKFLLKTKKCEKDEKFINATRNILNAKNANAISNLIASSQTVDELIKLLNLMIL